jgi:DNA sulfur modification protein DndD
LLAAAHINPDDFRVQLLGTGGHELGLGDFSAGERQLYAMALLWALRQVSGQQLPLAVDTPLARLDEIHRQRLMRDYVPAVSDQVLLLATDVELDDGLLTQAGPYLARIYRLDYDPQQQQTTVTHEEMVRYGA